MTDYEKMKGKVIDRIEDAKDRQRYGDDPGFIMYFTDGSTFTVEAGMGQGAGYLIENFEVAK